ncbi:glycosyltransferase [bacterium]|nr:glycosyltransferase [bacterium]
MINGNKNPTISVVMPVYNAENYLDEAIQSILNQTYKDFEFIIINDGSTDKSLEIIEKYKNIDIRITLINRENRGLIASLNEGVEKAEGKYIARMDADDISLPERFEKQIELMEKDTLDICGCHYFMINENNEYIDTALVPLKHASFMNYLSITTPFAHPSVMIRRNFIIKNNLYYGNTKYKSAEDYALWIEFWNGDAKLGNVNEFLFKYRDFGESLSKKNKKGISNDKRKISKNFIINNKNQILNYLNQTNVNTLAKREQEIVVLIIFFLLKYDFSISYFRLIKKINKRSVICGFFKFIKEKY